MRRFYLNNRALPNGETYVTNWPIWGIEYTSGANLSFGEEAMELKFNFSLIMSTFSMHINSDNAFILHINLCAIFIILLLIHFKERTEEAEEIENKYLEENVSDVDLLS